MEEVKNKKPENKNTESETNTTEKTPDDIL
jgi:hypothetical protein